MSADVPVEVSRARLLRLVGPDEVARIDADVAQATSGQLFDTSRDDALARVWRWSKVIHGARGDRHDWCMAAAAAILDGLEIPPFPGRPQPGVAEARLARGGLADRPTRPRRAPARHRHRAPQENTVNVTLTLDVDTLDPDTARAAAHATASWAIDYADHVTAVEVAAVDDDATDTVGLFDRRVLDGETVNLAIVTGPLAGPPEVRHLASGKRVATFAVRTATAPGPNTSVPVAVWNPPPWLEHADETTAVVVAGNVRRRFYRQASGALAARVEVEAQLCRQPNARGRRAVRQVLVDLLNPVDQTATI